MFLKTHKCASSSIQNIFLRFGDSRDLFFALPKNDNYLGHPTRFSRRFVLDPFMLKNRYNLSYSIIAHHLRFNYKELVTILPEDTVFVTILRDPVKLFESLFVYYDYAWSNPSLKKNLTLNEYALLFRNDRRFADHEEEESNERKSEQENDGVNEMEAEDEKRHLKQEQVADDQEVLEAENAAAENNDEDEDEGKQSDRHKMSTSEASKKNEISVGDRFLDERNHKENERQLYSDNKQKDTPDKKNILIITSSDSDVDRLHLHHQDQNQSKRGIFEQRNPTDNALLRMQTFDGEGLNMDDKGTTTTSNHAVDDSFNQGFMLKRNGINYGEMSSLTLKTTKKRRKGSRDDVNDKAGTKASWTWTGVLSKLISNPVSQEEVLDDKKKSDAADIRTKRHDKEQLKTSSPKKSNGKTQLDVNFRVRGRFGRNQMAFDLGFNQRFFDTPKIISNFIDAIDSMFHLVLITERFEESLVLLKHLLCWSTQDVVTFQHNMRAEEYSHGFLSRKSKGILRKVNLADQMIYDHFSAKFDKIVNSFGVERMKKEVQELKNLTNKLYKECVEAVVPMHEVLPKNYWPNLKVVGMKSRDLIHEEQVKQHKKLKRERERNEVFDHDHTIDDDIMSNIHGYRPGEEDVVNNFADDDDEDDDEFYLKSSSSTTTDNPLMIAKEKSILCQQLTLPEIVYTNNLKRKQQIMLRNRKLGLSSSLNPIHHLMMKPEAAAAVAFDHNHRYLEVTNGFKKQEQQLSRKRSAYSGGSLSASGIMKKSQQEDRML